MDDTCTFCHHEFQNFPCIELSCHHRFHTHCFLGNLAVIATANPDHLLFLPCRTCEEPVFAQQEEVDVDQPFENEEEQVQDNQSVHNTDASVAEETRINSLWTTNTQFRQDIQNYIKATRCVAKPRREFQALVKTKKDEVAPTYALIKAQYEGLYNVKKDELMSSTQYKTYRSADMKQIRYWYLLQQKYNLNSLSLIYLRSKRGCKTIHRPFFWRSKPKYLIRRALRIRFPWR